VRDAAGVGATVRFGYAGYGAACGDAPGIGRGDQQNLKNNPITVPCRRVRERRGGIIVL